jgi:hypothetical protein
MGISNKLTLLLNWAQMSTLKIIMVLLLWFTVYYLFLKSIELIKIIFILFLILASRYNHLDVFNILINVTTNLNIKAEQGNTALIYGKINLYM